MRSIARWLFSLFVGVLVALSSEASENGHVSSGGASPVADLRVTNDNGAITAVPGGDVTYTITVESIELNAVRLFGLSHIGADGPAFLYEIDPANGGLSAVGPVGFERCGGMDFDAAGILFAACERTDGSDVPVLVTIDTANGAGSEIGPTGIVGEVGDLSFREDDGALFAIEASASGPRLFALDTVNGSASRVGETNLDLTSGNSLAFDPAGQLLHTESLGPDIHTLDSETGQAQYQRLLELPPGSFPLAKDHHPETGALFAAIESRDEELFELAVLDPATGVVTPLGPMIEGMNAIAFRPPSASPSVDLAGVIVTNNFPPQLDCEWTCVAEDDANCTSGPVAGDVVDTIELPVDTSVSYIAICHVAPTAAGVIVTTATVSLPSGVVDPYPSDNSATDIDPVVPPMADVAVFLDDGIETVVAGRTLTYEIIVENHPSSGLGRLFVYSDTTDDIREIDPLTGVVLNTFPAPVEHFKYGLATTPTTLLAAGFADGNIFELDPDTGGVLRTLLNPGIDVTGLAFLDDEIFVLTDQPRYEVRVLDYATGATLRTISALPLWTNLAASTTELLGIASTQQETRLFEIDPLTGAATLRGDLPFLFNTRGLGIIGDELYAAQSSEIAVIDLATFEQVRSFPGFNSLQAAGADGGIPGIGDVDVFGATVSDTFPSELSCSWTCIASAGATCTPGSVAGDIDDLVNLPIRGSLTYTAVCDVDPDAFGSLTNTVTVSLPAGVGDPDLSNNSATDTDEVVPPSTDLRISNSNGINTVAAGGSTIYSITIENPAHDALDRLFAYDHNDNEIREIDPVSRFVRNSFVPPGGSVFGLATTPTSLLVAGFGDDLFELDPDSGQVLRSVVDLETQRVDGLAFLDGEIFVLEESQVIVYDDKTGTLQRTFSVAPVVRGLGASTTALYGADFRTNTVYDIDPLTGSLTPLGIASANTFTIAGVGFIDDRLYLADFQGVRIYDPQTLQHLGNLFGANNLEGIGADGGTVRPITTDVIGATVSDIFPPELDCTWTCATEGGAHCTSGPVVGNLSDTIDLPVGSEVIYTVLCDVDTEATDSLMHTATVTLPEGILELDATNNNATDIDSIVQGAADLAIVKDDGVTSAVTGESVTYTIDVENRAFTGLGRLFVFDADPDRIIELDPQRGDVLNEFPAPVPAAGFDYGLATTSSTLLAGGSMNGDIFELDPDTGNVIRTLPNPGIGIKGMAFRHPEIFLLEDSSDREIVVLDYTTGAVLRTLSVSPITGGLSASPTALYGTNNLTLYDIHPLTGETTAVSILRILNNNVRAVGVIGDELFAIDITGGMVYDLETLAFRRGLTNMTGLQALGADAGAGGIASIDVEGAVVSDVFPPELTCIWTCETTGQATCTSGPVGGDIIDTIVLPFGDTATFTAECVVDSGATTPSTVINTATVSPPLGVRDPTLSNNSSTDVDILVQGPSIFRDGFESGDTSAW